MIASVRGVVLQVSLDRAVLEVGGVGFVVWATPATLAGLRVGQSAQVFTSLVVREDSLTLYGFADDDERAVFEIIQSVSGIGPRIALAVLAVHQPDSLRHAVAHEDLAALMRVPGIGRKGAQRMVLELGHRLGPPLTASDSPSTAPMSISDHREQVIDALVSLGWNLKAAQEAVQQVVEESGVTQVTAEDVPQTLRSALRALGGARG